MMTNHSKPNTATTTARPIVTLRLTGYEGDNVPVVVLFVQLRLLATCASTRGSRRLHMRRRPEPSVRFPAAGRRVADDA